MEDMARRSSCAKGVLIALIRIASSPIFAGRFFGRFSRRNFLAEGFCDVVTLSSRSYVILSTAGSERDFEMNFGEEPGTMRVCVSEG